MSKHASVRACLALFLLLAWPVAAGAQPNTPEYAAKMAYEAAHGFDVETLLEYACVDGQERIDLRRFFSDQVHNLEAAYGIDWREVAFDFSGVRYEVLEQVGDTARVRIFGPYTIIVGDEREVDEDPDVIIVQRVEGQWLMCGDQDLAQQPLAGGPASSDTVPAGQASDPGSPEQAAMMAYQAAHRLDADAFGHWACVEPPVLEELKAEFAALRQDSARAVGVSWSDVDMDFSGLQGALLEQVDDRARVRVWGSYLITYPGGREVSEDDQIILLERVEGRWLMCGDQDQALMPLSPYSSPRY